MEWTLIRARRAAEAKEEDRQEEKETAKRGDRRTDWRREETRDRRETKRWRRAKCAGKKDQKGIGEESVQR